MDGAGGPKYIADVPWCHRTHLPVQGRGQMSAHQPTLTQSLSVLLSSQQPQPLLCLGHQLPARPPACSACRHGTQLRLSRAHTAGKIQRSSPRRRLWPWRGSAHACPPAFHRGPCDGSSCLRLLARTCGTRRKAKRALATLDGVPGSQPALLNAAGAGSFTGRQPRGTTQPQSSRQTRVQSPQPDIHTCISLTLLGW